MIAPSGTRTHSPLIGTQYRPVSSAFQVVRCPSAMSQHGTPFGLRTLLNHERILSGTSVYWPLSKAQVGSDRTQILISISIRMRRLTFASRHECDESPVWVSRQRNLPGRNEGPQPQDHCPISCST